MSFVFVLFSVGSVIDSSRVHTTERKSMVHKAGCLHSVGDFRSGQHERKGIRVSSRSRHPQEAVRCCSHGWKYHRTLSI